jgi:ribosomal protein L22
MSVETPDDQQKDAPQPDEEARVEVATGSAPQASEPTAKAKAGKPARARKAFKAKESAEAPAGRPGATGDGGEGEAEPAEKRRSRVRKPARAKKAAAAKEPTVAKEPTAEQEPPAAKPAEAVAERPAEPAARPRTAAAGAKQTPRRKVVRAHARYVRTSARKARMVCGHLRGKSVQEARAILAFTPREVARDWSKLLESAVANAESNHELLEDDLIVREAYADEGPTIKRFRPRAMGRATPIRKRTSHLTITLTPGPERPTTKRHG